MVLDYFIWNRILSFIYFDYKCYKAVSRVCKQWNKIANVHLDRCKTLNVIHIRQINKSGYYLPNMLKHGIYRKYSLIPEYYLMTTNLLKIDDPNDYAKYRLMRILKCNYNDGKLDGTYERIRIHKNVHVKEVMEYKNNVRNGKYSKYFGDVKIKECFYKEGKLDGEHLTWTKAGDKKKRCFYYEDKLIGTMQRWSKAGKLKIQIIKR